MATTTTVILGGGFGGLAAANALRRRLPAEHDVVVVDATPRFYVGAGKTWIMLGQRGFDDISAERSELLDPGVRFVQAGVSHIDLAGRRVATEAGELAWDYLVLALGAEMDLAAIPGLPEAAHSFYTVAGAERLRDALAAFTGGDIALVIPRLPFKCPPAPYEAAILLQEQLAERGLADTTRLAIYTVEGAPMGTAGAEMGRQIQAMVSERGIAFHPKKSLARVDGASRQLLFADDSTAGYDLLIAVPPHVAPAPVRAAGLTGPSGWVPVDPATLRVTAPGTPAGVFAVGDITAVPLPGRHNPEVPLAIAKAGVIAAAEGQVAADQIASEILHEAPGAPFDGQGYCYLETGGGQALRIDVEFFALPHPRVAQRPPDAAQMADKVAWVARQLGGKA